MKAIFKREFNAYFTSPVGYIYLGFILLLGGWFFVSSNLIYSISNMAPFFGSLSMIIIFLVPILTMRLFAEDNKNKTDQLLLTSPVSVFQIIMGKFLSAVAIYGMSLSIMLIYPLIMSFYGEPQMGTIIALYIGCFLMGSALISVGLFISSTTESQITAAIITLLVMLFIWLSDWIASVFSNKIVSTIISWLSVINRYDEFMYGVLSLSSVIYFISFSAVFVFLAVWTIEKKRWS